MKHLRDWRDLRPFGIDALTGEACGLAMRILCDVTEKGAENIQRFLGGRITVEKGGNWNGGSKEEPHIGSVLLPYSILSDLSAFLLVVNLKGSVITLKSGEAIGAEDEEDEGYIRTYLAEESGIRVWRRSDAPGTGDRNRHAMSGRTD